MAQKKIYCYAATYGTTKAPTGMIFIQARNATRAECVMRTWMAQNKPDIRHPRIAVTRWERVVPSDAVLVNEYDYAWLDLY